MSEWLLLGLFHEATSTADTIESLRTLGVPDEKMTVMSGIPYMPEMLGRTPRYERLMPIALVGALSGLAIALFLTVGTPLLYAIQVGGQDIIPGPPSLIIIFELTMLGTIIATFGGLLAETRFPSFGRDVYDFRITEGHIGVLAGVEETHLEEAAKILSERGALHLQRMPARHLQVGPHLAARWALVSVSVFVPAAIALLFAYAVVAVPLPDQMVEQPSVAYEEGPRGAAPAESVPFSGPDMIGDQPASAPLPATEASVQRGKVLFGMHCALCHGAQGQGDGPLAKYFSPPPVDLSASGVQKTPGSDIFRVITEGTGPMPPLAENLPVADRWDVVNYVRTLKK